MTGLQKPEFLLIATLVAVAGCSPDPTSGAQCAPLTCAHAEAQCGTLEDGCGGILDCGACPLGLTCGVFEANKCGCVPKTCADSPGACGSLDDGCGGHLECSCAAPQSCGGGGVPGVCGCTPITCAQAPGACGSIDDGCGGQVECGCSSPETCGGGGVAGQCGCTPITCAQAPTECGTFDDGCGGQLQCGCSTPETCGGGGVAGQCGCTPIADCAEAGANCGSVADGCGGSLQCGDCADPLTCGGGGVANLCGPTPSICLDNNWCWENPWPQGHTLYGLWASSANDVWAVGEEGTILRWDGSQWNRLAAPTSDGIVDVYGFAPNDVWIVTYAGAVYRWNGTGFSQLFAGGVGYEPDFFGQGIWGSSPNDVWISTGTFLVHFDGTSWDTTVGAGISGVDVIRGFGPNQVWAGGHKHALTQWNGSAWSTFAPSFTTVAFDFSVTSPNDIWLGGDGVFGHWDGTAWTTWNVPHRVSALMPVSSSEVWLALADSPVWMNNGFGFAHWDGTNLTYVKLGARPFNAMLRTGPNDGWAVGGDGLIARWNGFTWRPYSRDLGPQFFYNNCGGFSSRLFDVWGAPTGEAVVAAWDVELTATGDCLEHGLLMDFDGQRWRRRALDDRYYVYALNGWDASNVWVGAEQAIYHWDGQRLTLTADGAGGKLYPSIAGFWGNTADDVWFVGSGGAIGHWNGQGWTSWPSPTTKDLADIWGFAQNDIYAVGVDTVLHWDGSSWSPVPGAPQGPLYAVWGISPGAVFVSEKGHLDEWDGVTWTQLPPAPGWNSYTTLRFGHSSGLPGYAVTQTPRALWSYDGATWTKELGFSGLAPFHPEFLSVHRAASGDVWAVGTGGMVLRKKP